MADRNVTVNVKLEPGDVAAIIRQRDRYLEALGSLKDQAESASYAAPEMLSFWLIQMRSLILDALGDES